MSQIAVGFMYNRDHIAHCATLACLLEAGAEKPGNVTPTRSFRDMAYEHFVRGAVAIGPEMTGAGERGVGETILAAVQAARQVAPANTNLGIVLLFAPLAKGSQQLSVVSRQTNVDSTSNQLPITDYESRTPANELRGKLARVLRTLTLQDARTAYAAIRLAFPGGLQDRVEKHDVRDEPAVTLREAMAEAAGRDSLASEYLSDYAITFERGLPALTTALSKGLRIRQAVVQAYLELLAAVPDTLIARKRGRAVAEAVSRGAAEVLAAGGMFGEDGRQAIAAFDADLRDATNSLNPGASADLIAAALFVALLTKGLKNKVNHDDTKTQSH